LPGDTKPCHSRVPPTPPPPDYDLSDHPNNPGLQLPFLTSTLVVSSPIAPIRDIASEIGLQRLYTDSTGYKSFLSPSKQSQVMIPAPRRTFVRYSLLVPPLFVRDPAVELAKSRLLDPSYTSLASKAQLAASVPDVAFGPMGRVDSTTRKSNPDTNISVVINRVQPPFSLERTIGSDAEEAAEKIIKELLCPPGSGRTGTLLTASKQARGGCKMSYVIEYTITIAGRGNERVLQAVSVLGSVGEDTLVTYTAVAPEGQFSEPLRKSAESFLIV